MPQRAHWKGWLKLSLVSCPIALYPAIAASERVSFRQINRSTGNRLRQQLVDEVSGDVVQSQDKARGYEVGERQYVMVEDVELDRAREEARTRPFNVLPAPVLQEATAQQTPPATTEYRPSSGKRQPVPAEPLRPLPAPVSVTTPRPIENNRTIMIDRFIMRTEIDTRYYDTPYYITPREEVGAEAFAVIRDAMAAKNVVGLARVVLARRERPILIDPFGKGLCGTTLRYAHEVRDAADYFAILPEADLPDELIALAMQIIDAKKGGFDVALLEDRYRTVLVEALKEKTKASRPHASSAVPPLSKNVIDLMAMLKQSMVQEKISPAKSRAASPSQVSQRSKTAAASHRTPTKRSKPVKGR